MGQDCHTGPGAVPCHCAGRLTVGGVVSPACNVPVILCVASAFRPATGRIAGRAGSAHTGGPIPMPASILVVEDEPAIRDLLAVNLRHGGYRPLQASD